MNRIIFIIGFYSLVYSTGYIFDVSDLHMLRIPTGALLLVGGTINMVLAILRAEAERKGRKNDQT